MQDRISSRGRRMGININKEIDKYLLMFKSKDKQQLWMLFGILALGVLILYLIIQLIVPIVIVTLFYLYFRYKKKGAQDGKPSSAKSP